MGQPCKEAALLLHEARSVGYTEKFMSVDSGLHMMETKCRWMLSSSANKANHYASIFSFLGEATQAAGIISHLFGVVVHDVELARPDLLEGKRVAGVDVGEVIKIVPQLRVDQGVRAALEGHERVSAAHQPGSQPRSDDHWTTSLQKIPMRSVGSSPCDRRILCWHIRPPTTQCCFPVIMLDQPLLLTMSFVFRISPVGIPAARAVPANKSVLPKRG